MAGLMLQDRNADACGRTGPYRHVREREYAGRHVAKRFILSEKPLRQSPPPRPTRGVRKCNMSNCVSQLVAELCCNSTPVRCTLGQCASSSIYLAHIVIRVGSCPFRPSVKLQNLCTPSHITMHLFMRPVCRPELLSAQLDPVCLRMEEF